MILACLRALYCAIVGQLVLAAMLMMGMNPSQPALRASA